MKPDPRQRELFPRAVDGALTLRPYQLECDRAIDRELALHRSTLVVEATGLGKSVTFAEQARKRGGAIVVADRDALITQAAWKLGQATGETVAIEKAERHAFGSRYVCASIQTCKGKRLEEFAGRHQDIPLVVIDEADLALAPIYRRFLAAFPRAKVLGVTATADRRGLAEIFDSIAYTYDVVQAIEDGWLAPLSSIPVEVDVDLDKVRKIGGDLDPLQLDDAIAPEAAKIARSILDHGQERMIVFTPGVKTAHITAGALDRLKPGCAKAIDGYMDDRDKGYIIDAHRAGEFLYLVNCNVLSRGYDDAELPGMFDAAPSASRTRYAQRVGRILRPWPGVVDGVETAAERQAAIAASPKPVATVLDLACNGERHSIVGAAELLGSKFLPEERAAAKKALRTKPGSVLAALEEARARIQREHAARAASAVLARLGKPRTVFEMVGLGKNRARIRLAPRPEDMATPKQLGLLRYNAVPVPPACTKAEFRRLIGTVNARKESGKCGLGVVEWLGKMGVPGQSLTRAEAMKVFRAYVAGGSKPLSVEAVAAALV